MAGKGATGGTRGGDKLSYTLLSTFDDLMTETLVDKAYYWAIIRKNQPVWTENPLITTEDIVAILRHYVINQNKMDPAADKLLQLPGFAPLYRSLQSEKLKKYFTDHLLRYINIYRPDCRFEITATNRFTIEKLEASVTAREYIRRGTKILYLQGFKVSLTPEEDEELKRTKRDFSVVISGRNNQRFIFLGPARFCNHDCEPNASLNPCDNDGMEVTAIKDISVGEEITVNYASNYFDEDNSKCLCMTCEDKLDKGFIQMDDNGQRILPAPLEEVDELDENGNPRRVLRERRTKMDYTEKFPTPSPTRGRRRRRAPSLSEAVPGLSEEFVRDESMALSVAPSIKERTPTPPPPPKRRVPRKMLPRDPDPEFRGITSAIFPGVRGTWILDPGSTDEEDGAEQAAEDEVQENESVADSERARVLEELRDKVLVPDSVRDHGVDLGDCLAVGVGIITSKQSTPATSIDAEDHMDTNQSSAPRPSRGLKTKAETINPFRARGPLSGSSAPGNGTVPMAPMSAPATRAMKGRKRTAAQMSSGKQQLAPIDIDQSESEGDRPIPRAGATSRAPMEISDFDDHPIPPLPLTTDSTQAHESATDDEDEDVTPELLRTTNSVASRGATTSIWAPNVCLLNLAAAMLGTQINNLNDPQFTENPGLFFTRANKMYGIYFHIRHLGSKSNAFKLQMQSFSNADAIRTTFYWRKDDGSTALVNVNDYFLRLYSIRLKFPRLPLVVTHRGAFPLEVCFSADDERYKELFQGSETADNSVVGRGASAIVTQQPIKKSQGRPFNAPRELPAQNFYGGSGAAGHIVPVSATPENSPPKIQIPSTLKRKLLPTPQKGGIRALPANTAFGVDLKAVDQGDEADSESDGTVTETPSRKRQRRQHSRLTTITLANSVEERPPTQEEEPIQRIPGDYLLTEKLLKEGDEWVGCNLCLEFYVQEDSKHKDAAERYCPRCVRHAKLYGVCWPKTNPVASDERRGDWLTILMEGKWDNLAEEGKRISKRRALIDRTLKKQQEMLDPKEEVDAQIRKEEEDRSKSEDNDAERKAADNGEEDKVLDQMDVGHAGNNNLDLNREIPDSLAESEDDEDSAIDVEDSEHAPAPGQEEEHRTEHHNDDTQDLRPGERTINCPQCGVQRKRKGNKRQRFGAEIRYICFVCVQMAEAAIMADTRGQSEDRGDRRSSVGAASADPVPTAADEEPVSPTELVDRASPQPITQSESDVENEVIASPALDNSDVESDALSEPPEDVSDADDAHKSPTEGSVSDQLSRGDDPGERIRSCFWVPKTDWPCTCGLLQVAVREGADGRCNLTLLGMETLRMFSHRHWARAKAEQLLGDLNANKARELVSRIFEQQCGAEEIRLFYNQDDEDGEDDKEDAQDVEEDAEDAEGEERAQAAQPSASSPQEYSKIIARCYWQNQFGCGCKLLNRIREEATSERCFLMPFGIDTLKKSLHDHEYRSHAVQLLQTEALDETKQIFASVLRSTYEDERTYHRCYAGDHPGYRVLVEEPNAPNQFPRTPENSVVSRVDDDDAISTSSVTFLSENRVDGTPANPQTIPSPVQAPRRLGNSSSAVGLNPASAPATSLGNVQRPFRSLMGIQMGTYPMEELLEYQRSLWQGMSAPKKRGSKDEPITLDSSPPGSPTASPGPSMPLANMGGASSSRASLGAINERPAVLRPDGTPKSAREVLRPSSSKGKGTENQRQSAQRGPQQRDEDSDEMLHDGGETPLNTPGAPSATPSTSTSMPNGPTRVRRRNRMGGRGQQYGV